MGVANQPLGNADPCGTHCRGTDTSAAQQATPSIEHGVPHRPCLVQRGTD